MLDGALRALLRKRYDPQSRVSVKFADDFGQSERAVDAGGPAREFFRLVVEQVVCSSIFAGTSHCKYLTYCNNGKLY